MSLYVAAGQDFLWRQRLIACLVPFFSKVGGNGGQAICSRDLSVGAKDAANGVGLGPLVDSGLPKMVRPPVASPPDLLVGTKRQVFRFELAVFLPVQFFGELWQRG
jgi:hypothetical protein